MLARWVPASNPVIAVGIVATIGFTLFVLIYSLWLKPKPEIYRLEMIVRTPDGAVTTDAEVAVQPVGEVMKTTSGWMVEIPVGSLPADRRILVKASQADTYFGEEQIQLAENFNPVIELKLADTSIKEEAPTEPAATPQETTTQPPKSSTKKSKDLTAATAAESSESPQRNVDLADLTASKPPEVPPQDYEEATEKPTEVRDDSPTSPVPNSSVGEETTEATKRIVFYETFDDNHNKWPIFDPPMPTFIENGHYVVMSLAGGWRASAVPAPLPSVKNFNISCKVTKLRGDDNYFFGLLWNLRDLNSFDNFAITGSGHVAVTSKVQGAFFDHANPQILHSAVNPSNATNLLRIEKRGARVTFLVNNQKVHAMEWLEPYIPNLGFIVYGDSLIAFDNYEISILQPEGSAP